MTIKNTRLNPNQYPTHPSKPLLNPPKLTSNKTPLINSPLNPSHKSKLRDILTPQPLTPLIKLRGHIPKNHIRQENILRDLQQQYLQHRQEEPHRKQQFLAFVEQPGLLLTSSVGGGCRDHHQEVAGDAQGCDHELVVDVFGPVELEELVGFVVVCPEVALEDVLLGVAFEVLLVYCEDLDGVLFEYPLPFPPLGQPALEHRKRPLHRLPILLPPLNPLNMHILRLELIIRPVLDRVLIKQQKEHQHLLNNIHNQHRQPLKPKIQPVVRHQQQQKLHTEYHRGIE